MSFQRRLVNRRVMPTKHILVCEDDLMNQKNVADHFTKIFDQEGHVQFSFVCGGEMAAATIEKVPVDVILLDHDMPFGNGVDLLEWMKMNNHSIPVLTFSGINSNNFNLMKHGATYFYHYKHEIIDGVADHYKHEIIDGVVDSLLLDLTKVS